MGLITTLISSKLINIANDYLLEKGGVMRQSLTFYNKYPVVIAGAESS